MTLSTAEKIETITLARTSGAMGSFTEYAFGLFRVEADGLTVLVRRDEQGWHVTFKGFQAIDPELYIAARDALDAGKGTNATRLCARTLKLWS